MFTHYNDKTTIPIRIWLPNIDSIEEGCLEQAYNLSNLPFVHKWVSLMPDTHKGVGMPIGAVLATKDVIIPNAVGVDIGCGMIFCSTNIKFSEIKDIETPNGSMVQVIIGDIMRNIPIGRRHHKKAKPCTSIDNAFNNIEKFSANTELLSELEDGYFQIGTLGGGNHFIELQKDEEDFLCIMMHSGSRHLGRTICDYFNNIAKENNAKYYSSVPTEYNLPFLLTDSYLGKQYINWMNLALDFAHENREKMLIQTQEILSKWIGKLVGKDVEYGNIINCHHNYASLEMHYDEEVWVHRKGATRANDGEIAVIPGAMGSFSYVVMGKGNKESFCSSSHGAGRKYSRTGAKIAFSVTEVMEDLKEKNVILGKTKKSDVAEECRFAYKNIDEVMANQSDLVMPIKKLETIGVVKG